MARRVFLHIGTMKSGTTYIQQWCELNRERLADAGILWSVATVSDLLGGDASTTSTPGTWRQLADKIARHEGDCLLSNEILSLRPGPKIKVLLGDLDPAEAHVVITARDLARTLPSQWQEGARNRQTFTWAEFIDSLVSSPDGEPPRGVARWFWQRHDLVALVRRWRRLVPMERISIVTVPPPGAEAGAFERRFAQVVGFDPAGFVRPREAHPSLGAHSTELMLRLNARAVHLDRRQYRSGVHLALSRDVLAARAGAEPMLRLTPSQAVWAQERGRRLVDGLQKMGVRFVGDAEELVPRADRADDASSARVDPAATSDELLDVALDGLVGLAEAHAALRLEYDALVRALEARLPSPLDDRATPAEGGRGSPRLTSAGEERLARGRRLREQLEDLAAIAPKPPAGRATSAVPAIRPLMYLDVKMYSAEAGPVCGTPPARQG